MQRVVFLNQTLFLANVSKVQSMSMAAVEVCYCNRGVRALAASGAKAATCQMRPDSALPAFPWLFANIAPL